MFDKETRKEKIFGTTIRREKRISFQSRKKKKEFLINGIKLIFFVLEREKERERRVCLTKKQRKDFQNDDST